MVKHFKEGLWSLEEDLFRMRSFVHVQDIIQECCR